MKRLLVRETDPAVEDLRKRLDQFYRVTEEYQAFQSRSWHPHLWSLIVEEMVRLNTDKVRVLEIGAGRSGFYDYLRQRGVEAHFTAQDVTAQNVAFLRENADDVVIGPLQRVTSLFDIIFNTFVLEHVTDPVATLEKCWSLLKPGGTLFIFCPRYDAPFYLSHSADHYTGLVRFGIALRLAIARLLTLLTQSPRFYVHTDPSVFVLPWQRDRDAVHWVSYFDLVFFFRRRGLLRKLRIPAGGLKDAIVKNLLQVNIAVQKPGERVV